MIKAAILTISSTRTKENDLSGQALQDLLKDKQYHVLSRDIVKDDIEQIKNKLIYYSEELNIDLVLTTGGTGLGSRDVTPEATSQVIEQPVLGISEIMRIKGFEKTDRAVLSRGISGIKGKTLIINLPGSPKGVQESFKIIKKIIPHAIDMIKGMGH